MNQYQFQAPPLTKVNKIILVTAGVCFLAGAILRSIGALSLPHILGLSSAGINNGFVFQLVTYPFVETQLMSFIFSGLIIWFVGSELEALWSARVYTRFLLLTIVGVGLIYVLIHLGMNVYSAPLHGLSGVNFALLVAYAVLYPHRQMSLMMIFPMQARTFCLILAGIEAYLAIFSGSLASWPHLFAMAIAFLIIRFQTNPLIKKVLNSSFTPTRKKKGHLYVVKKDDENPPKYWQ
jgi:membrane associated rhomboid family serine protease